MSGLVLFGKLYFRSFRHYVVPPRWRTYFPFVSLVSLGLALLALEFAGFQKVFNYLNNLQDFSLLFVQFLLERLVALIFLISFSMIIMSSMINGLSTLFLSTSLPFLFTLPIPRWKVLTLKFVENWFVSCYLVVAFLACFLASYIHSFQLSYTQYAVGAVLLLLFTLAPVALGTAAVTTLIRFFPVRRIHQVVTLIGGVFVAALMIAVRMMKPELLLNPKDTDDFRKLMMDMTIPSFSHLPSTWAANVIVYGNGATFFKLLLFTAGTIGLMALVLKSLYDRAFIHSQESRSLRGKPVSRGRNSDRKRSQIGALVIKDLKIFMRDATQWSQLLLLAALVVVYLINIKNLAVQLPMVRWIVSFLNLGLAGFVLAALSVRFLFPSVSSEGRAFWVIRTIPVSFRRLLWCKYLIYFPPFLLFTEALVYFSNRILGVDSFFIRLSMLNILAVSFALTGLAIGIGALMPNFKADHPSQIAVGPGGVLYMLISFVYLGLMLAVQMRPVWYVVIHRSDSIQNWMYIMFALLLTLVVSVIPMEWGAARLAKREML